MERRSDPERRRLTVGRACSLRCLSAIVLGGILAGCGGKAPPEQPPDAGPSFIADQGDFSNFASWESFDGGTDADDSLGIVGQRVLYLNHRPPTGLTQFPLGTIIVKTTQGGPTFAMARRGGGFNPQGLGWEWFELAGTGEGPGEITWRGNGTGGMLAYGTTAASGCDDCHFQAIENDYVAGTAIQLSSF